MHTDILVLNIHTNAYTCAYYYLQGGSTGIPEDGYIDFDTGHGASPYHGMSWGNDAAYVRGNAQPMSMRGNAQPVYMRGNAQPMYMRGNAQPVYMPQRIQGY
jgi:hypothetical protein